MFRTLQSSSQSSYKEKYILVNVLTQDFGKIESSGSMRKVKMAK